MDLGVVCGRILFVLLLGQASAEKSFQHGHEAAVGAGPADIQLRVHVQYPEGRTAFHMGERIPIRLEFTTDAPGKYTLNATAHDRSGRMPTEEFVREVAADAPDPYQDYFDLGVIGSIMGGAQRRPILGATPEFVDLDLNDWVRFDKPGMHRLYLRSHRISKPVYLAPVSQLFEVRILPPDPNWESDRLLALSEILKQGPLDPLHATTTEVYESRRNAARELRFLATPGAVRFNIQQALLPGFDFDTLLLIGTRHRSVAVEELDRYIAHPIVPLRGWDIRLRALFSFVEKERPTVLPASWMSDPSDAFVAVVKGHQARYSSYLESEATRIIPLLKAKESDARKQSAEAIAEIAPKAAAAAGIVPPDDYGLTRTQLIEGFATFPKNQQEELLEPRRFDLIRGREIVPALISVITAAQSQPLADNPIMINVFGPDADILAGTALLRLAQVAPLQASEIIRKDIAAGEFRFRSFAMQQEAARSISEADAVFIELLKSNPNGAIPVIARFGSPELHAQMAKLYQEQRFDNCFAVEHFVVYFTRITGNAKALKERLANVRGRSCMKMLISRIAAVAWNSDVEATLVELLQGDDAEFAKEAAGLLAAYGGGAVESRLWARLQRWSETWKGRTAELASNENESNLGWTLIRSLTGAKSWIMDEPRRERLRGLCIDEECRKNWAPPMGAPPAISIEVVHGGDRYPAAYRVNGYGASTFDGLKSKLQQYPAGTSFAWCPQDSNPFDFFTPGQRIDMFDELTAMLSKRSMTLQSTCAIWTR
jgi:hypothetical protein